MDADNGKHLFSDRLPDAKKHVERPKPALSGQYGRFVPGSSRNCQIWGIPLVLAESSYGMERHSVTVCRRPFHHLAEPLDNFLLASIMQVCTPASVHV